MQSRAANLPGCAEEREDVGFHAIELVSFIVSTATKRRLQDETRADRYLGTVGEDWKLVRTLKETLTVHIGDNWSGGRTAQRKQDCRTKDHESRNFANDTRQDTWGKQLQSQVTASSFLAKSRNWHWEPRRNVPCLLEVFIQPTEWAPTAMDCSRTTMCYHFGIELFLFAGDSYVEVCDYQTNFPEVERLAGATATEIISKIWVICGVPVQACNDNGNQFASRDFAPFARHYGCEHIASSSNFPRSNEFPKLETCVEVSFKDFWLIPLLL